MKVALIARSTLFKSVGGDTVQIMNTASALQRLGINADIHCSHGKLDYQKYQVLHFFNITRPADILMHVHLARRVKAAPALLLTPILIDYSEFDRKHRKGFTGLLFSCVPTQLIEPIKVMARVIKRNESASRLRYLSTSHNKSMHRAAMLMSKMLASSETERKKLQALYGEKVSTTIVHNGIDPELFKIDPSVKRDPLHVLCVARIEGLKNQLNLIRALNNTDFKLTIVGNASLHQHAYYSQCLREAGNNIKFISHLPQEELLKHYATAKVHVLPSWFETCGLSSLEAVAMGCNIVVSDKGYVRDYHRQDAVYCDPADPHSIRTAIESAAAAQFNEDFRTRVTSDFTWTNAAERIAKVYHELVKH